MIKLSAIKRIENEAHKIGGVVSLAQGIPSAPSHEIIRTEVIKAINNGSVDHYSLSSGLPELRSLLSEKYKADAASEIIVTAGAIEALSAVSLALFHPGDEIITFSPFYTAYGKVAALSGAKIIEVPLSEKDNWRPDIKNLREKITASTRAILLCSPNNPTGAVFSEKDLKEIGEIALEKNLIIVSDDVYKEFYYTKEKPYFMHSNPAFRKNLISVISFSKNFSLSGWRVGFILGPAELVEKIFPFHDVLVNCAPVVSQYAAIAALKFEDRILPETMPQYGEHRKLMGEALESMSQYLDFTWPEGSYYFFPRIKNLKDSEKFCFDMLREAKIAAVPGSAFGSGGEGHIRLCFGRSREDIIEGMKRFKNYLVKWSPTV